VTTSPATTSDFAVLPTHQANLATRQLTQGEPLVDAGYVISEHLLTSRTEHGIDLIGPVADDQSWQGQAGNGFAAAQFVLDWDAKDAICPQGQRSVVWMERPDRHGHPTVRIAFSKPVCGTCASRTDCTRAVSAPRALRIRERDHYTVLQTARVRQQKDAFKKVYARRAGIDGTIAQGTRTGALRRSRDIPHHRRSIMHRLTSVMCWLILGIGLVPAFAQPAEEALKKLQGTWTATTAERDGTAADDVVGHRLSFTGNRLQIQSKDGKPLYAGTVRVDPSTTPAAIDFEHMEGALKGKAWKGIYALDGDTLTTCDNAPNLDKGRPAAFEAKSGSGYVLITFTRAKP
jgi:uncharacterized protein (TIGR03067 family)